MTVISGGVRGKTALPAAESEENGAKVSDIQEVNDQEMDKRWK